MDPITVLQNRIEQLEAKLGFALDLVPGPEAAEIPPQLQHGDSATTNLMNAAQNIQNATAGHEKLSQAMTIATELNNYTDPNFVENRQQNQMHMQEVVAAEPMLQNHCQCMHHCQQAAPVMESEAFQKVPQMQVQVDKIQAAAAVVKQHADEVTTGIQQIAETCGQAASMASEHIADVAQKVDGAEEKLSQKRRNGLD